jgi:PAS domain S-box-containing protein
MSSRDPAGPRRAARREAGRREARALLLASIVDHADDAIVSLDLNATITSWNDGAARLLGYTEAEAIGRPMMTMITVDRHAAEVDILACVHRGERVGHHESVWQHKDGSFAELSVAVSPIRSADSGIIGVSMIARHSIAAGRTREEQDMLYREMGHRIRNLFALASGVVALSARFAQTPHDMADTVRSRLDALARAHDLTLPTPADPADRAEAHATMHALIRTIVLPYGDVQQGGGERVTIVGPDVPISGSAVASFALLLHEFATNAAKYGALSSPAGHVEVMCDVAGDELRITWREHGGPALQGPALREGFGSLLGHATVQRQLGGSIAREWNPDGLTIRLVVSLARLTI